jgi:HNH endonuclease
VTAETFRRYPADPRILVGDHGTVIGVRGKVRKPTVTADGYHLLSVSFGGAASVHALVCETYHGPKPSPAHQAAHLNGNPSDNRPSNLAWKTPKENAADRVRHGTWPPTRK